MSAVRAARAGLPWTTKEEKLVEGLTADHTIHEIVEKTGRSYQGIRLKLREMGLKAKTFPIERRKTPSMLYAEDIAYIMEKLGEGNSYKTLAGLYALKPQSLKNHVASAKKYGFAAYPKKNTHEDLAYVT